MNLQQNNLDFDQADENIQARRNRAKQKLDQSEKAIKADEEQEQQAVLHPSVLDKLHVPDIPLQTVSHHLSKADAGYCDLIDVMYPGCILYDNLEESFYAWNGCHWQQNATGTLKDVLMRKLSSLISSRFYEINEAITEQERKVMDLMAEAMTEHNIEPDARIKEDWKIMQLVSKKLSVKSTEESPAEPTLTTAQSFLTEYERLCNLKSLRSPFFDGKKKKHGQVLKQNQASLIMSWAKSQFGIDGSEWDQCTNILPVANGVIDLSTGKLKPTTPNMMIKNYADIEYHGLNSPCLIWEQSFNQIMWGNEDKRFYLQKLYGMSLLGRQREHVFPILYGKDGRNGKDLMTETITKVLGPMASKVDKSVILKSKRGGNDTGLSPQLMQLKGLRFAYVNETEQGDIIDQAQVKELTGGGSITARGMRENMQRFSPSHILFLTTNSKPHIRANDRAIWERARVIELLADFQDSPEPNKPNQFKKDMDLAQKLESELDGVLSWLVRGCVDYLANGLQTPDSVMHATNKYREDEDTVGKFISGCCYVADDAKCKATELYRQYVTWCDENGIKAMNSESLGKIMNDKGYPKKPSAGMKFFGIGILAITEMPK